MIENPHLDLEEMEAERPEEAEGADRAEDSEEEKDEWITEGSDWIGRRVRR